jgi:hypothetical protein
MRKTAAAKASRKEIIEDRIKYLDHVYSHGLVYSVWDRLLSVAG